MSDEEFVKKYEELLDKMYCNCNEMNCIDNNSPRRILNIAKRLQLEEDDLLKENQELKNSLERYQKSLNEENLLCSKYAIEINDLKEKLEQCSAVADTNSELADSIDEHYKRRQKKFIEWLEQNIENEEYCYLAQNPGERCRKDVFEEVLSKYKEIVGGSNG